MPITNSEIIQILVATRKKTIGGQTDKKKKTHPVGGKTDPWVLVYDPWGPGS